MCFKKQSERQYKTTEQFITESIAVHGKKYIYTKTHYVDCHTPVEIICPEHGSFFQVPYYHLDGNGCPICGIKLSKKEKEIYEFCCNLIGKENVKQNVRNIIHPYELDVYMPSLKIAIEYNGIYWHSDKFANDNNYHLRKTELCKKKGIKLIQVFEDEYVNNKDIVLSKIKHLLHKGENLPRIFARKCTVKEITTKESEEFLNKNHIQGAGHVGGFYNDELIAVMSFNHTPKEKIEWELTRFASDNAAICIGIGGKLFSYFISHYNPNSIKSFADRRWTLDEDNNIYKQLGFQFEKYTHPDYKYFKKNDGIIRQHKFNFRKQILHKKYGLPLSMTENEMTKKLGYSKIYDCGLIKYVWYKKTSYEL